MLVIDNLVKNYKYFNALDHISINIGKGNIYGIIGEYGSGKTTLMKIIAGLLMPDSGKVELNGVNIFKDPKSVKRSIGYLPELFGVYDELKVNEYMNFYLGVHGIQKEERLNISNQLLELVDLSDKKNENVSSLSFGEKKWLCMARGLINNPELLILDEPTSGLDSIEWNEMSKILKTLQEMGKTVLITSQNLSKLAKLCTLFSILEHGKITVSGNIDDVTRNVGNRKINFN